MTRIDIDRVSDLLRQALIEVITPRFRALNTTDVEEKSPGEVVTVADQEAETLITRGLQAIAPGVPVVGEEAVAANPSLLSALKTEPLAWLVDPLDGTANFVAGVPHWGVEIALVEHGETVASWMLRADETLYVAERKGGAWKNGEQLIASSSPLATEAMRGAVLTRFLTDNERETLLPRLTDFGEITNGYKCTAYEYPALIEGSQEFALFQRLLPWDHAAGCLLLCEAGGTAAHPDGTPFRPDHGERRGLLLAHAPATWQTVRDLLYPEFAAS